jgi:hypothetical protein
VGRSSEDYPIFAELFLSEALEAANQSADGFRAAATLRPGPLIEAAISGYHSSMFANMKFGALAGLVCIAVGCMTVGASAVTAEVAKKCAALTAKVYPPRVPGNPAAGLAEGTAQSKRDYFNKCVANGGNMDDQVPKQEK